MQPLDLSLDAAWAAGLVLAITRVGAFAVASPLLARAFPPSGRLVFTLAVGTFLASPVTGVLDVAGLLAAGVMNAALGVALGFLTGLVFHLFTVAGGLIDMSSGLSVASLIDPTMGEPAAVFSRLFNLTALLLLFLTGGFELLVRGLALSVETVPLDGSLNPSAGLADLAVRLVGRMLLAGAELALPVLAALFLTELVLGLAARLAPQANVFLLGLPLKLFVTLSVVSVSLLLFPEAIDGLLRVMRDGFVDSLRGLTAG